MHKCGDGVCVGKCILQNLELETFPILCHRVRTVKCSALQIGIKRKKSLTAVKFGLPQFFLDDIVEEQLIFRKVPIR